MNSQEGSSDFPLDLQEELLDANKSLLDCEALGHKLSKKERLPSIYRVPSCLRDISPRSYEPRVVSIGPLHREDKTLQEFESQKAIYLHHLLKRNLNDPPKNILDNCLRKVNDLIPEIRECYAGVITSNDVELAKMMVIDACFILEFLFPSEEHQPEISGNFILNNSIYHDLMLLENQIPFIVLQHIFECTFFKLPKSPSCLASSIHKRLEFLNPFKENFLKVVVSGPPHDHILGLLQKSFHPTTNIERILLTRPSPTMQSHSALELDKAGVKFKPNKNGSWPLAIDFTPTRFECFSWCCTNRTLRMPVMCIDEHCEPFLRNVIAYEQCTPNVPNYVTSYAFAIDYLVDTTEDLSRLIKSNVMSNLLGSNEEATSMINNLTIEVIFNEFCYVDQWNQLDGYYNGCWPKNIARLKRKYFNSPWNAIALLAGIILFALTIIQTIYTVKAK